MIEKKHRYTTQITIHDCKNGFLGFPREASSWIIGVNLILFEALTDYEWIWTYNLDINSSTKS